MKIKILSMIAALGLAMSILVMPAKSEGVRFAVGVYGQSMDFDTSGTETETTGDKETTTTSKSTSHDIASVFVEANFMMSQMGLVIGVDYIPGSASLGSGSRTDAESPADRDSDDGTYTANAEVSDHVQLYVEPTFYMNDTFGIYVKGGLNRVMVKSLESIAFGGNSSAYGNKGLWGTTLGVGLRADHSSGLFMKVEYSETDYDSITLTSSTGNANTITADPESKTSRLAIGYQF